MGKPHGIRGDVYVVPISDDPDRFAPGARLVHEDGRTLTVARARRHGDRFLVSFEGVEDREGAETLRGALFVDASQLRALDEDEFWTFDLIQAEVTTATGERVGAVTDVVPGSAHDLLEVETPRGPRLVPLVKAMVVAVDPDARSIVIDPPEGLLD